MSDHFDIDFALASQGGITIEDSFRGQEHDPPLGKISGIKELRAQAQTQTSGPRELRTSQLTVGKAKDLWEELYALWVWRGLEGVQTHPRLRDVELDTASALVASKELNVMVHTAKSREAGKLNAEGPKAQLEYLVEILGREAVRELLPHLFRPKPKFG